MGEIWGNQLRSFPQTPSLGFFPLTVAGRLGRFKLSAKTRPCLRPGNGAESAILALRSGLGGHIRPTNSAEEAKKQIQHFSRKQIEASFRKFTDLIDDLESADHTSWMLCLKLLVHHCRSDAVMQVVLAPLASHDEIDIKDWATAALEAKQYTLPVDDEERLALMYRFLVGIHDEKVNVLNFGWYVLKADMRLDEAFAKISDHFVRKFGRDVGYRLEEALERIEGQEPVSADSIAIFGDVIGSAVGTGATVVANDIIVFAESLPAELKAVLTRARDTTDELGLADDDTRDVLDELRKLFQTLSTESPDEGRIRRYWNRIVEIAPPVAAVLQTIQIVANVATSAASG